MSAATTSAAAGLAQALAGPAAAYPTDPEGTAPVIANVTAPATGEQHRSRSTPAGPAG
ncbi:hypothetical protein SUDANB120_05304 [Streptomyces sp. enrichment culture]|uniref:hypothetical protein n=1 Tax=Streptomyces sp. enrichment culture TaxID=1795815 RepID=UPI003F5594B2